MTFEELRLQDLRDVRVLLATREGARFFSRLVELTGLFSISYEPGDATITAFNEGKRQIGLELYADLMEADPGAFRTLTEAGKERDTGQV